MPQSDCLPVAVGALAAAIAKDMSVDNIAVLAAIFTQLGDSLALIAVTRGKNCASAVTAQN